MENPTNEANPQSETTSTESPTGYVNGSDMLLMIDELCVGHCTSHKVQYNTDTKQHNVKAPASVKTLGTDLFSEETVTGLSLNIDFEGLQHYEETENSIGKLRMAWKTGKPVTAKCFRRAKDDTPYLVCPVVITSLTEDNPARDDSTFSGSLKNSGAPTTFTE